MKPVFILFALVTLGLLSFGLYQALVAAPTEQTMGEIQRIFYYHVPSAWVAFVCFFANFGASIWYLATKNERSDAVAVAAAEVGVVFNTIVLLTGPLWAKPVWGIWWTWDARLTSTFIMWLIYISYLLLRRFSTADEQTPKLAAALAIFGFVDVPIVYMSIRWWRTQHPSPVIGGGENSGLDPHMLHALLWNFLAFAAYGVLIVWRRYQLERGRQELNKLYRSSAQGAV
jgi:heme exporter protein C